VFEPIVLLRRLDNGRTALGVAAASGCPHALTVLARYVEAEVAGCAVSRAEAGAGSTPAALAAANGHAACVTAAIAMVRVRGDELEKLLLATDSLGRTMMHSAAMSGDVGTLAVVVDAARGVGSDMGGRGPNASSGPGRALESDPTTSSASCLDLLLHATDTRGRTALAAALDAGSVECAALLAEISAAPQRGAGTAGSSARGSPSSDSLVEPPSPHGSSDGHAIADSDGGNFAARYSINNARGWENNSGNNGFETLGHGGEDCSGSSTRDASSNVNANANANANRRLVSPSTPQRMAPMGPRPLAAQRGALTPSSGSGSGSDGPGPSGATTTSPGSPSSGVSLTGSSSPIASQHQQQQQHQQRDQQQQQQQQQQQPHGSPLGSPSSPSSFTASPNLAEGQSLASPELLPLAPQPQMPQSAAHLIHDVLIRVRDENRALRAETSTLRQRISELESNMAVRGRTWQERNRAQRSAPGWTMGRNPFSLEPLDERDRSSGAPHDTDGPVTGSARPSGASGSPPAPVSSASLSSLAARERSAPVPTDFGGGGARPDPDDGDGETGGAARAVRATAQVAGLLEELGVSAMDPAVEDDYVCPITQEVMTDPVVASDGHTYEREAIEGWIARSPACPTSPMTRERIEPNVLLPNLTLQRLIHRYLERLSGDLFDD
jgi:hypothetical protein